MEKDIREYLEKKCLGETRIRAVIDLQFRFDLNKSEAEKIYNFWRRHWCDINKERELDYSNSLSFIPSLKGVF